MEEARGTRGQRLPVDLLTLDGPRRIQRPHRVSCFLSHPSNAPEGVAKLRCTRCTKGTFSHMPLPGAWCSCVQVPSNHEAYMGRPLLQHGAHQARHPSGLGTKGPCTENPHCIAPPAYLLVRPDPEHHRARPGLTNSSSWTGL